MDKIAALTVLNAALLFAGQVSGAVVSTSGTVALETSPYPAASNTEIFVFDEIQDVAFVASQSLNFGTISPGTRVNSHYVVFDPVSPSGSVGGGTITFDGAILGVVTSTDFLDQDLSADGAGTSDLYFGLAGTLGSYEAGADPTARGLGSPEDDLAISIGSSVLTIDSLGIPAAAPGNVDGFRVFTAPTIVPLPTAAWLFGSAILGLLGVARRRA